LGKYYIISSKNISSVHGLFSYYKAIRADGNSKLSHEIGLELSRRSAAAGLRYIFIQV
jgi:hypothetical protein